MPLGTVPSGVQIYYIVPSASPDRTTSSIDPTRPTVILLHPWFFDSRLLARQYEDSRLAKGYNLIVIDHHYHGKTQLPLDNESYNWRKAGTPYPCYMKLTSTQVARDILSLMDALKIKKAHVLGNSLSSHLAVFMANKDPERIQSLALISPMPPVQSEENLEQYRFLRDSCYERADDGSDQLASDVLQGLQWMNFGNEPSGRPFIEGWAATTNFRPSNPRLITKICSAMLDGLVSDKAIWQSTTCPILILHGGNDMPLPASAVHEVYDLFQNAPKEIHYVEGAPHLLNFTHYVEVNKLLANFFDKVTGVDSRLKASSLRKGTSSLALKEKRSLSFKALR